MRTKHEARLAKTFRYDEVPLRVGLPGSGKYWHTATEWVVRDRGLASFRIARVDDLAHTRIRHLMEAVGGLTDWTKGIKAVMQEKQGSHNRHQWSSQIEAIWRRLEQKALFPLFEESP